MFSCQESPQHRPGVIMETMKVDLTGRAAKAVEAIIYEIRDGERYFLVVQQADGSYALPCGYKEVDDGNLLVAMKRVLHAHLHCRVNVIKFGKDVNAGAKSFYS